jgi:hypothetical protein
MTLIQLNLYLCGILKSTVKKAVLFDSLVTSYIVFSTTSLHLPVIEKKVAGG